MFDFLKRLCNHDLITSDFRNGKMLQVILIFSISNSDGNFLLLIYFEKYVSASVISSFDHRFLFIAVLRSAINILCVSIRHVIKWESGYNIVIIRTCFFASFILFMKYALIRARWVCISYAFGYVTIWIFPYTRNTEKIIEK